MLDTSPQAIARRISELAKNNSISINRLMNECGLSKNVVDNLKRGSMPSVDKLAKISEYFEVDVNYLLGKVDTKNKPIANKSDELVKERETILLEKFRNASPAIQELVLKALDADSHRED